MTTAELVPNPLQSRASTTVDAAAEKLRHAVMHGQLLPGQKLIEATLCRELDISRPSLREALRVLEAERLIELVPNRGPQVAKLGLTDVQEIHEVWSLLTGRAAYLFAEIASPEDIAAQEAAYAEVKAVFSSGVSLDLLAASNNFFRCIASRCGNHTLFDVVTQLVSRINFLRAQAILHQRLGDLYAQELGEIMDAIREKNPGATRRAVERHIASVCASAKQMVYGESSLTR
jgi:DNA-binding GntR family transcriptional regulator